MRSRSRGLLGLGPRAETTRLTRKQVMLDPDASLVTDPAWVRPRNRSECKDDARPCPWMACRYHLYLDVTHVGSLTFNFPGLKLSEIPSTCALDVADTGAHTLEEVGVFMNLTRERIRQVEVIAFEKLHVAVTEEMTT